MASLIHEPNGRKTIQFRGADRKRHSLRLGVMSQRAAESIQTRVEFLANSIVTGHPLDSETAKWVADRPQEFADKLAAVGLIPKREPVTCLALGPFLSQYIAGRESKPLTITNLRRAAALLTEHFGEGEALLKITPDRATGWRDWLRAPRPAGKKMGINTSRRHVGRARQFFAAAIRSKLIQENPFRELSASLVANRTRDRFVTREESKAITDACPNATWRLLWSLTRYAGLRCPSEVFALRWSDVDWDRELITVTVPKLEHHEGKESRIIPIFADLRPHLEAAFDSAPEGSEFCIMGIGRKNCGTHMRRIIKKAGVKVWPKLFVNCRASLETELAETLPIQTVVAWIGHSTKVALKNYLQVPAEHYRRASGMPAGGVVQNPVQPDAATTCPEPPTKSANRKMAATVSVWPLRASQSVPPAGFEPATYGLGNRRSIP